MAERTLVESLALVAQSTSRFDGFLGDLHSDPEVFPEARSSQEFDIQAGILLSSFATPDGPPEVVRQAVFDRTAEFAEYDRVSGPRLGRMGELFAGVMAQRAGWETSFQKSFPHPTHPMCKVVHDVQLLSGRRRKTIEVKTIRPSTTGFSKASDIKYGTGASSWVLVNLLDECFLEGVEPYPVFFFAPSRVLKQQALKALRIRQTSTVHTGVNVDPTNPEHQVLGLHFPRYIRDEVAPGAKWMSRYICSTPSDLVARLETL